MESCFHETRVWVTIVRSLSALQVQPILAPQLCQLTPLPHKRIIPSPYNFKPLLIHKGLNLRILIGEAANLLLEYQNLDKKPSESWNTNLRNFFGIIVRDISPKYCSGLIVSYDTITRLISIAIYSYLILFN